MRVAGIIAEYNPFHNGHRYQLDMVRKTHDAVVCVMSGGFVQRGDIAVFDKWTRAEAALLNGADLVLELPAVYACATAERFAYGAVSLFDSLGIIDSLCFGSECGDTEKLRSAAELLAHEPPGVSEKIKAFLEDGLSFPVAREQAFSGLIDSELLHQPNNLLGLEYCKALLLQNSNITPQTILRAGCDHHAETPSGNFASAGAIRTMLQNGEEAFSYLPQNTHALYQNADFHSIKKLETAIFSRLRVIEPEELRAIADVGEGLEHRLIRAAQTCTTYEELLDAVVSKRYPRTKIQRILLAMLLGISQNDRTLPISYLRVLGFTETGRGLLRQIKQQTDLPIVTKTADFSQPDRLFALDLRASDLFGLCGSRIAPAGTDFIKSPVFVRK